MKFTSRRILISCMALLWFAAPALALPDFADLAVKLKPSVVNISTSKTIRSQRPPFPRPAFSLRRILRGFFRSFFPGAAGTAQGAVAGVRVYHICRWIYPDQRSRGG